MTMIIASILFFFFGAIIILQNNINEDVLKTTLKVLAGSISLGVLGIVLSYS